MAVVDTDITGSAVVVAENASLRENLSIFRKIAIVVPMRGIFGRLLFNLMAVPRQRYIDKEIARYLASTGGILTDSIEFEIERRFLSDPSHR